MHVLLPGIPTLQDFSVTQIEIWLLSLLRVSFCIFLLPVLMGDEVPLTLRVGLSFFVSLILFPTLPQQTMALPENPADLLALALRELYVGAIMGFAGTFAFFGLRLAGAWMDQEIGFSSIQMFNPVALEEETAIGSYLQLVFGMLLVASGGYLFWLRAIGESFQVIPIGGANLAAKGIINGWIELTTLGFLFGIKASAPVLVTLFLTTVALAIVARIMPQVNAWLVGMPLKIGLGVVVLSSTLPLLWDLFQKHHQLVVAHALGLQRIIGVQH
jgi:flagellar biosynthesis protein FliR